MATALADSIADIVLGLATRPAEAGAGNRLAIEGLTLAPGPDGAMELGIGKLEAGALRLASGPHTLDIAQLAVHGIAARIRVAGGKPRLEALTASRAELTAVQVNGPLDLRLQAGSWSLAPLAGAEGAIRAEIVDAHLVFDADVTVPVRQGVIEFRDATVEHVGPDSRMGASRLGIHVDAPNGRSYLYQFSSSPVPGVEYESRGGMLGPWATDRGRLHLQPFMEWLLRQPASEQMLGVSEQARQLFDRTKVSGELRLGDGRLAAPGVQADLTGRAEGRNALRLHSEAVGRGLTLEMASLSVKDAVLGGGATEARCDEITGGLALRVFVDGGKMRFAFELATLKMAGLHLQRPA